MDSDFDFFLTVGWGELEGKVKTNQSDFFPLPPSLFLPTPLSPSDDSDFFPHFPSSPSSSSFFVGIDGQTGQGGRADQTFFLHFSLPFLGVVCSPVLVVHHHHHDQCCPSSRLLPW